MDQRTRTRERTVTMTWKLDDPVYAAMVRAAGGVPMEEFIEQCIAFIIGPYLFGDE